MNYDNIKLLLCYISVSFGSSLFGQDSLNMELIHHWDDSSIIVTYTWGGMDQQYNEIWGYYDSTNSREYAIIGTGPGTYIFDVTNQNNVLEVEYELGSDTADIHRDYKTYKNYLYAVADEGDATLQIFDMSYLPDSVHKVYDSNEFAVTAHNCFIEGTRLYLCGVIDTASQSKALRILDISNPENPTYINDVPMTGQGGYTHDIYVRNDTAYCSNLDYGLYIYDFTNPNSPALITSITSYLDQGVNHSSWLSEDGKTLFFVDESLGMGIKAFDVSDMSDVYSLSLFRSNVGAMPHNVFVNGNNLYVSYYHDGIWVFDVEDPSNPTVLGYYDTYIELNGYKSFQGCWGVYPYLPSGLILGSDFANGLFVLKLVDHVEGVADLTRDQLNVYPNTVSRMCFVQVSKEFKNAQLSVYDNMGKIIERFNTENYSLINLDMSHYVAGIYHVEVIKGGKKLTRKIIKKYS